MGWSGEDMEALIDLGEEKTVRRVGVDCLQAQGPWIFLPQWVEVSLAGEEDRANGTWTVVGRQELPLENDPARLVRRVEVEVSPGQAGPSARFIRVRARNQGPLPDWHPGAPENAWLFVDEIVVEGD